jgi:3-isopropylmalate/(R)-2-methylmalate dehydratase small subunit
MEPISQVVTHACPIDINDVDTDLVIPKKYLKSILRTGYGQHAFAERRYFEDGTPDPSWPMNKPEHQGAGILLSGRNFGCGSSREHAAWAIKECGYRVVIAESFADIFRLNCAQNGMLAVQLPGPVVRHLFELVGKDPSTQITVDLEAQRVTVDARDGLEGVDAHFDIDESTKYRLLNGLDAIGITLQYADDIAAYEARRPAHKPRTPLPS